MTNADRGEPAWATALIERLCADDLQEELLGDFEEACRRRRRSHAPWTAALLITIDALSLLRPSLLRRRRRPHTASPVDMISNYARVAWRGFRRNRSYSLLNVFGLGIGVACCLLIGLYIADEMSVDRLYRVTSTEADIAGAPATYATTQMPLRTVLESTPDRARQEESLVFVDSSFFDVFPIGFVRGEHAFLL